MAKKNSLDYSVTVSGRDAIVERTGELISLEKGGCLFRYKKPRSSKRITQFFDRSQLVALYKDRHGSDVLLVVVPVADELLELKGAIEHTAKGLEVADESGNAIIFNHPQAAVVVAAESGGEGGGGEGKKKKKKKKNRED